MHLHMTPRVCVTAHLHGNAHGDMFSREVFGGQRIYSSLAFLACARSGTGCYILPREEGLLFINPVASAVLYLPCLGQGNS